MTLNSVLMDTEPKDFFNQKVIFVETTDVVPGVQCDVYKFEDDETKDLGIVRIEAGMNTPLQKLVDGKQTFEGYISGRGKIVVHRHWDGYVFVEEIHEVGEDTKKPYAVEVRVGDMVQIFADENSSLTIYEVCFPPFQDGRFETIPEA